MRSRNTRPVALLIVSDNYMFRSGLSKILEPQAGIFIVGEASFQKTVAATTHLPKCPELILLDLDSRTQDAIAGIEVIQKGFSSCPILALTDLADHELARKAVSLGVAGVVLKIQPPAVLIAAIQHLCPHHDFQVRPEPLETDQPGAHKLVNTPTLKNQKTLKIGSLTPREREIIRLVGLGLKNKEIASRLSISDITVRHHLTSIFCKLEIPDRQKLLILAHRHGLADLALQAESA
jgi:DNA-binding NarL/FixJ family response regulator